MKKLIIIVSILILFSSCEKINQVKNKIEIEKSEIQKEKILENLSEDKETKLINRNTQEKIQEEKIEELPKKALIEAEFICQAPLQTEANWVLHEESCEEAALLQTYNYEKGILMTKNEANLEILDMIKWQNENFNGHHDIYADKIKEMAIDYYGLKEEEIIVENDVEIERIKEIIAKGHPVIAPVTSKFLKNPYYPHPGYHMLQVIGFDENYIITNDNGTRKGEKYPYKTEIFKEALNNAGSDILYLDIKKDPI